MFLFEQRDGIVFSLGSFLLRLYTQGRRGGPRGPKAPPPMFRTTKSSLFSTNALSRFAIAVLDGVLAAPALSGTLNGVLVLRQLLGGKGVNSVSPKRGH